MKNTLEVREMTITPSLAAKWLEGNTINRPIQPAHVRFLSALMQVGLFLLNGDTIKISDADILDGQHRLLACIDSGRSFRSLVVFGVPKKVFKTIDEGRVRTGRDALFVHYPGITIQVANTMAAALVWHHRLTGALAGMPKVSNTALLEMAKSHKGVWQCCDFVLEVDSAPALVPVSSCAAMLYIFQRRHAEKAATFIRGLLSGEKLARTNPAFVLRKILANDLLKRARLSNVDKVFMSVKAWHLFYHARKGSAVGIHRRGDEKLILDPETAVVRKRKQTAVRREDKDERPTA
ncbi:MAG: hypothetical protein V3V08_07340 [Nannocystaceae bacterium]